MLSKLSIIALLALALGWGCQGQSKWAVPTTVVVNNLGEPKEVYTRIQHALSVNGRDYGFEILQEQPFTFRLNNVRNYAELAEAQAVIQRVLTRDFEPTRLASATLIFQSVQGTVKASIQASGEATPGSTVWVDIGAKEPTVVKDVPPTGKWAISIEPNPVLLQRQGQVFALIRKEQTIQLVQTNVFDAKGSTRIPVSKLPDNSCLRPLLEDHPPTPPLKEPDQQ